MTLNDLKEKNEAPHWLTEEGFTMLSNGYLLPNETPKGMYARVAKAASQRLNKPDLELRFFDIIWKNWLCLATPVAANMGTTRGLPISCNTIHVGDSVDNIYMKNHELAMLSKYGAGVGIYFGDIRGRGTQITGGYRSEGIVPWAKCFDSTTLAVSQGSTRRGASAIYLPIDHPDIEEFLDIRKPTGDVNRRCMNIHHAVCITDSFMNSLQSGEESARKLWEKILYLRFTTGEPYLFFSDNVNRQRPQCYVDQGRLVSSSNICTEIYLYTDPDHSFVCCLSSLNLMRWDEWKDTDTVQLSIFFLDAVMEEYIQKAITLSGFEAAVNFASKSRALGLGVLGWHSLLQSRMIPFDSFDAMQLNAQIFKSIKTKSDLATRELAKEFGEPEWCKGYGIRNTHLIAVAPTASNSLISGNLSAGIEPVAANIFSNKTAKGTFILKNPFLVKLLQHKDKDNREVWNSINSNDGSVQHLTFLTPEEKEVFLTAREINQFAIVKQAAQRQKWIDQGQSVNLFFATNSDPKYIHEVHMEAWATGLKSLYYCRAESVLKGDNVNRQKDECKACEG